MTRRNMAPIAVAATTVVCVTAVASYYVWSKRRQEKKSMSFRIVSLCPSTTLTLYDLGLSDCVVGRTRYCQLPKDGRRIAKVGGTKDPKWHAIAALKPTHILFNLEENDYTQLQKAQEICETIVHTPVNVQESKEMVLDLGRIFGVEQIAQGIAQDIDDALAELQDITQD